MVGTDEPGELLDRLIQHDFPLFCYPDATLPPYSFNFKCFIFPMEFRIEATDEMVTLQHGQDIVAVDAFCLRHECFKAIFKVEQILCLLAIVNNRIKGTY